MIDLLKKLKNKLIIEINIDLKLNSIIRLLTTRNRPVFETFLNLVISEFDKSVVLFYKTINY